MYQLVLSSVSAGTVSALSGTVSASAGTVSASAGTVSVSEGTVSVIADSQRSPCTFKYTYKHL